MTDDETTEPATTPPTAPPATAAPATAAPAGPAGRPRRRLAWIAALVAVVAVAGGAALVLALTSGGGSSGPDEAVQEYDRVFKKADCDGFTAVTTRSFQAKLGLTTCEAFDNNAKDQSIASFRLKIVGSTTDGDSATVRTRETFTSSTGKQSINLRYALVKDGGDWKVNGITEDKGA